MAQPPARTTETMMAELVHHVAEMVRTQAETNRLLQEMIARLGKK